MPLTPIELKIMNDNLCEVVERWKKAPTAPAETRSLCDDLHQCYQNKKLSLTKIQDLQARISALSNENFKRELEAANWMHAIFSNHGTCLSAQTVFGVGSPGGVESISIDDLFNQCSLDISATRVEEDARKPATHEHEQEDDRLQQLHDFLLDTLRGEMQRIGRDLREDASDLPLDSITWGNVSIWARQLLIRFQAAKYKID